MKLVTYRHPAHGSEPNAGILQGDRILHAGRMLGLEGTHGMLSLLSAGPETMSRLSTAVAEFSSVHSNAVRLPVEVAAPVWESVLFTPLPNPPAIRDFYAFEKHVATGYTRRGRGIPAAWYQMPVFYFAHTGNLYGHDEVIPKPPETNELDFELELAAVIGKPGRDIAESDAWDHVAGFTIMNDWSARDLQRSEMSVGLGPAKSKDFATSLGPVLVTIDELRDRIDGATIDLIMTALVNDAERSRDTSASIHWSFPALIRQASLHAELRPGDIIGSGTCGTGCIFEIGPDVQPWLVPGDEVVLEIERIGRLRSFVG